MILLVDLTNIHHSIQLPFLGNSSAPNMGNSAPRFVSTSSSAQGFILSVKVARWLDDPDGPLIIKPIISSRRESCPEEESIDLSPIPSAVLDDILPLGAAVAQCLTLVGVGSSFSSK